MLLIMRMLFYLKSLELIYPSLLRIVSQLELALSPSLDLNSVVSDRDPQSIVSLVKSLSNPWLGRIESLPCPE